MKKTSYIVGFLAAVLLAAGTVFHMQHWPGANVMRFLGCVALIVASVVAFISAWKDKQQKTRLWRTRAITGFFAALLIATGTIFSLLYIVSASAQILLGSFLLIFMFLPLYFYELYSQNITLEQKVQERTREIALAMEDLTTAQQELMSAHRQSEQARKKSDELLLNILPAEVAEELKASGSSAARQFDDVTVMFTDFVNFTQASEALTPQQLINELHTCFKAFDQITGSYKIEKIKTIGDAYLAVAGLPAQDNAHAAHVVKAAIEISEFMRDRKATMGNATFAIRIGIHSGSVVAGIVGVKKFAYDIWGDTVNTAARMEQSSEAGKINISETTYELVKDKFNCEYRGEIDAKNKGMMKMYFVK
jgi:class 3 adenylate cyclase